MKQDIETSVSSIDLLNISKNIIEDKYFDSATALKNRQILNIPNNSTSTSLDTTIQSNNINTTTTMTNRNHDNTDGSNIFLTAAPTTDVVSDLKHSLQISPSTFIELQQRVHTNRQPTEIINGIRVVKENIKQSRIKLITMEMKQKNAILMEIFISLNWINSKN